MKCANCHIEHNRNHRYCANCHAAYMRAWREEHPITKEQRFKANARRYALVYLQRNKIEKKNCKICGSKDSQMHHGNYTEPLNIEWLCRGHHLKLHKDKTYILNLTS